MNDGVPFRDPTQGNDPLPDVGDLLELELMPKGLYGVFEVTERRGATHLVIRCTGVSKQRRGKVGSESGAECAGVPLDVPEGALEQDRVHSVQEVQC